MADEGIPQTINSATTTMRPTAGMVAGDSYIVPAGGSASWMFPDGSLIQWDGGTWIDLPLVAGDTMLARDSGAIYIQPASGPPTPIEVSLIAAPSLSIADSAAESLGVPLNWNTAVVLSADITLTAKLISFSTGTDASPAITRSGNAIVYASDGSIVASSGIVIYDAEGTGPITLPTI